MEPRDSRCGCLYDPADELGPESPNWEPEEPEESEDVEVDEE